MTDKFKNEIERLLDEPTERAAPAAPDRLRARLAATFSEALDQSSTVAGDTVNPATIAAYIDGRLTGQAREEFAAALARQPNLRADLDQAADLAYSVADQPAQVPKALLARASAAFAPAPPRPAAPQARWSLSLAFASLLPRQRLALAAVAALTLIVAVPAGLVISGKFGRSGGEPELSSVEDQQDSAAKRLKECKEKAAKDAKDSKSASAAKTPAKDGKDAKDVKDVDVKDPCDPANLKDGSPAK
jgi:hypothetical protein